MLSFKLIAFYVFLRKYNVPVNIYVTDIYFFVYLTVLSICVPCSCGTQGHLNMCYFDNINDKLETIWWKLMCFKIVLDSYMSMKNAKAVIFIASFFYGLFLSWTLPAVMLFFIIVKCDSQEISLGKGNVFQGTGFAFLVEKGCILENFSGILSIIHSVDIPRGFSSWCFINYCHHLPFILGRSNMLQIEAPKLKSAN